MLIAEEFRDKAEHYSSIRAQQEQETEDAQRRTAEELSNWLEWKRRERD